MLFLLIFEQNDFYTSLGRLVLFRKGKRLQKFGIGLYPLNEKNDFFRKLSKKPITFSFFLKHRLNIVEASL
jgi:hypothetical protein